MDGEQMTTADHLASMLLSDGWKYAKDKFDNRVMDLQNIHNLDYSDPNTLNLQLAARKMAVELMKDWYIKDIVGYIEQSKSNNEKIIDEKIESYIGR